MPAMASVSLAGQVAVLVGAGRGIGRAIAGAYAEAGASVVCAARSEIEIETTVKEIRARGGRALAVATDVRERNSVETLFEAAEAEWGGVDIALLCAGTAGERLPVSEDSAEDWEQTLQVNLLGAYYCARAAIPHLKRRGGGKIIAVGSGIGHRGLPGYSAYAASKAGLWMLMRVLAQELREHTIAVNELVPGPVRTRLSDGAEPPRSQAGGDAFAGEWHKQPADVCELALFLAGLPNHGPTAQSFSLAGREL